MLTDSIALDQAVMTTSVPNLYLLDSEPNIPNPADIISSKSYARLTRVLEERFDYVIYDTPPVGTFVDAAILSTLVDGVILVVKPGTTKREELLNAYDQLKKAEANVIGTCATFCEGTGSEYYYAYYTQDGKRMKQEERGKASSVQEYPKASYAATNNNAGFAGKQGRR